MTATLTVVQYVERAAIHEAGHAAIALAFAHEGFGVGRIRASAGERARILILSPPADTWVIERRRRQIEASAVIYLSGIAAEEVAFGGYPPGALGDESDPMSDRANVVATWSAWARLHQLHPAMDTPAAVAWLDRQLDRARELVREQWPAIERLAAAVLERGELDEAEIRTLLSEVPE